MEDSTCPFVVLLQEDWSEFVDFDAVSTATQKSARQYLIHACRITWIEPHRAVRTPDWVYSQGNAVDDILKRLKSYDIPQAPPEVPTFKQILPVASPSWYTDWGALHNALKPHFGALVSFARYSLKIGFYEVPCVFKCTFSSQVVFHASIPAYSFRL